MSDDDAAAKAKKIVDKWDTSWPSLDRYPQSLVDLSAAIAVELRKHNTTENELRAKLEELQAKYEFAQREFLAVCAERDAARKVTE